jgi:type I restriction enzyme, S subunit
MSEWKEYKVGDLCHGIYDGPHATPEKTNHGPIFLGISNLSSGRIDLSNVDHLSEESFKKWTKRITPQANDVVFSYETRLGEAALIPEGLRCCLGRRMALMRPNLEKVDPQFLLYVYLSPAFQETISARTIFGSTVNRIALIEFPSYPIKIPSLKVQKSISSILYNIDAKIDNLRRQNETLEEIARSIFKHWFIDFEFPNSDGKPYRSSGGAMVASELGDIPEGWRIIALGDASNISIGRTPPRQELEWFSTNDRDIKWISIKDMGNCGVYILNTSEYLTKEAVIRFNIPIIPENTVIISFKLTVGRIAISTENMLSNEAIASVKITDKCLTNEYVYLFLKQYNFSFLGSTSSIATAVNSKSIKSISILIPSAQIIDIFQENIKSVFLKIKLNAQ